MVQVTGWVGDKPGWVTGGAGVRQAGDKLGGDGALWMTGRGCGWQGCCLPGWWPVAVPLPSCVCTHIDTGLRAWG